MSGGPNVKVGDRIVALEMPPFRDRDLYLGQEGEVTREPHDDDVIRVRFADRASYYVTSWRLADPEPYRPEKGHRVRVVLEGEAGFTRSNCLFIDGTSIDLNHGGVVSIERLPEPRPKWQRGDVVIRDEDNPQHVNTATYIGGDQWRITYASGAVLQHETATVLSLGSPRILVQDGTPVTDRCRMNPDTTVPGPLVVLGVLIGSALLIALFRLLDWVQALVTRGEDRWDETDVLPNMRRALDLDRHPVHAFEPGIDIDDPQHPDPRWCNVCGEVRHA